MGSRRSPVVLALVFAASALGPTVATSAAPTSSVLADEAQAASITALAADYGALGTYWDADAGEMVAVMPAEKSWPTEVAMPEGFRVERTAVSAARLEALLARLAALGPIGMKYGYWYSPQEGRVVLEAIGSDAPFRAVRAEFSDLLTVRVGPDPDAGRQSIVADTAPHWGASKLEQVVDGDLQWCTAGFTVVRAGTRYMTTSGHCYDYGDAPYSPGTGQTFGTVQYRLGFPNSDGALLGGSTYGGKIYTGLTGTESTNQQVSSAGDPTPSVITYCVVGAWSYRMCGMHVESLEGQLCDERGCTNHLIVYRAGQGVTHQGDSGGPFYLQLATSVAVRGIHVGRLLTAMYATKWSTMQAAWGLTIYTGP